MADRKKRRGKSETSSNKLSKEEDSIARFIRFNCPTNSTTFEGNEVHYFSAKKAIDLLVESKKYGASAKAPKFSNSNAAEDFLRSLLEKGLFFRARKVVLKKKDKIVDKKKESANKSPKSPKPKKKDIADSTAQANDSNNEAAELLAADEESSAEVSKKPGEQEEEKKRKKKVKLIFHELQIFVLDPADVYVWVFDPTPFYKKVIGLLIVLGTIAGCLFPLWPDWLRLVIYYLSVTGIALFGLLLGVALLRTMLFGLIWACTLGRHKLWVLPNLTEDCGFFESFKPFYTYEYAPGGVFGSNADAKKKKKKKSNADENDAKKAVAEFSAEQEASQKSENDNPQPSPSSSNVTAKLKNSEGEKTTKFDECDDDAVQPSASDNSDDDDEAGKDENHQSEEVSDDECASEGESDRESSSEQRAEGDKEVRRRNVVKKGSATAEDDFVIIDSSSTA